MKISTNPISESNWADGFLRPCGWCRTRFLPARRTSRACSPPCRNALWKQQHPEKVRGYARTAVLKRVGLTPAGYAERLRHQRGVCAACGERPLPWRTLAADQDRPRHVRGLVCRRCVVGLGMFGGSIQQLRRVVAYLEGGR